MISNDNKFIVSAHRKMINYFKAKEIKETIYDLKESTENGELYTLFDNPTNFVSVLKKNMSKNNKQWNIVLSSVFLFLFIFLFMYAVYHNTFASMSLLVAGWTIVYLFWKKDWLLIGAINPATKEILFFISGQILIIALQLAFLFLANGLIPNLVFGETEPLIIGSYIKLIFISFLLLSVISLLVFFYGYMFRYIVWFSGGMLQSGVFCAVVSGWYMTWKNVEISYFAPRAFLFPIVSASIIAILWFLLFIKRRSLK
jgi:hypothetical protein